MRLIDADALWEIFREKQNSLTARCGGYRFLDGEDRAKHDRLEITLAYIENAPEVDAVPVVRGEWVCNPDDKKFSLVCSVCGQVMPFVPEYLPDNPPFCNCGADMRGSEGKE